MPRATFLEESASSGLSNSLSKGGKLKHSVTMSCHFVLDKFRLPNFPHKTWVNMWYSFSCILEYPSRAREFTYLLNRPWWDSNAFLSAGNRTVWPYIIGYIKFIYIHVCMSICLCVSAYIINRYTNVLIIFYIFS